MESERQNFLKVYLDFLKYLKEPFKINLYLKNILFKIFQKLAHVFLKEVQKINSVELIMIIRNKKV